MTILQRAATIAVMTFSLTGLLGHSTPVHASGGYGTFVPSPAINAPALPMVPQDATVADPDSLADPQPVVAPEVAAAPAAPADYESLAQAVAAQDLDATDEAVRCVAGAVFFESKGEPLAGQLAVAQVILNRAKSGRFPNQACAVVTQRGQFSFVRGGRIPAISATHAAYRTAVAVAKVAIARAWGSQASAALYFNTPGNPPGARLTRVAAIGNHVFYR